MSFINKSVNFSQTEMLKKDFLLPLLEKYNMHMLIYGAYDTNIIMSLDSQMMSEVLIPNNNKKMYLYVTNKSVVDGSKDLYNILYFFPDEFSEMWYKENCYCLENMISDFYLEIDHVLNDSYLFEGYLYKNGDKMDFLITDVLIKNGNVVMCDYALRYAMLSEILCYDIKRPLKDLNNHISINIHPVVLKSSEMLIKILKSNFIYKDQLCCVEHVVNFRKKRYVEDVMENKRGFKKIEKSKYTDVYNVYNDKTNDKESILYIKGIKESKKLRELFKVGDERVTLECIYNIKFSKWEPIF